MRLIPGDLFQFIIRDECQSPSEIPLCCLFVTLLRRLRTSDHDEKNFESRDKTMDT